MRARIARLCKLPRILDALRSRAARRSYPRQIAPMSSEDRRFWELHQQRRTNPFTKGDLP